MFAFSTVPRRREWQEAIIAQAIAKNQEPFELPWQWGWGRKDLYDIDLKAMVQTNTQSKNQPAIRPAFEIVG